jgi:phospholipase C
MGRSVFKMNDSIEHVIILTMENRSFDHYLGALKLEGREDVDGIDLALPGVPDDAGKAVNWWRMDGAPLTFRPPHGWADAHEDYHDGAMVGFVRRFQMACPNDDPRIPMGYYTRQTLPVLYALADEFTVCDGWFASVLSSTWPNRKYLHSGKRDRDNDTQTIPIPGFQTKPIYDFIETQRFPASIGPQLTWKNYFSDLPFLAFWYGFAARHLRNFTHVADFVNDCREDALPSVSIIDPPFTLADDHPNHDPRLGEKFIALVVDALTNSESWAKSALIILYDEFGGFYDHVKPPPAPEGAASEDSPLGFRVPAIVVSPYSKKRFVSKVKYDHTSFMKSIADRWGMAFDPAVFGPRWQLANSIWDDCFDFTAQPRGMDIYTNAKDGSPPFHDLNWGASIHDKLGTPLDNLEGFLERIFILPELKALDRRASLFETLNQMERLVITLKRSTSAAPLV